MNEPTAQNKLTPSPATSDNILSEEYLRRRSEFPLTAEHAELVALASKLHQSTSNILRTGFYINWSPGCGWTKAAQAAKDAMHSTMDEFCTYALIHRRDHFLFFDKDLKESVERVFLLCEPIREKLNTPRIGNSDFEHGYVNSDAGSISDIAINALGELRTLLPTLKGALKMILFDCTSAPPPLAQN